MISYSVTQRTPEIGVRLALGAQRAEILTLIFRQVSTITLIGISSGLAGAWALSRYLASSLFEIKASDPTTYVLMAALLACVALIACWAPARRAARVDPVVALRHE